MMKRTRKNSKKIHESFERRSWEPWTEEENYLFFESLERNSRNWGEIAKDVGTKKQEQVRTYYYRVLRKINKILKSVNFDLDNRDRINTLIALLCFWEVKCETSMDDNSLVFAEAVKSRIIRQRQSLDAMRPQRLPSPEELVVNLVPKIDFIGKILSIAGYNPKIQMKVKSKEPINMLIQQIMNRWIDEHGNFVSESPLILYPYGTVNHQGYSINDHETSMLAVYHSLGCPNVFKLEYMWSINNDDKSTKRGMTSKIKDIEYKSNRHYIDEDYSNVNHEYILSNDDYSNVNNYNRDEFTRDDFGKGFLNTNGKDFSLTHGKDFSMTREKDFSTTHGEYTSKSCSESPAFPTYHKEVGFARSADDYIMGGDDSYNASVTYSQGDEYSKEDYSGDGHRNSSESDSFRSGENEDLTNIVGDTNNVKEKEPSFHFENNFLTYDYRGGYGSNILDYGQSYFYIDENTHLNDKMDSFNISNDEYLSHDHHHYHHHHHHDKREEPFFFHQEVDPLEQIYEDSGIQFFHSNDFLERGMMFENEGFQDVIDTF